MIPMLARSRQRGRHAGSSLGSFGPRRDRGTGVLVATQMAIRGDERGDRGQALEKEDGVASFRRALRVLLYLLRKHGGRLFKLLQLELRQSELVKVSRGVVGIEQHRSFYGDRCFGGPAVVKESVGQCDEPSGSLGSAAIACWAAADAPSWSC